VSLGNRIALSNRTELGPFAADLITSDYLKFDDTSYATHTARTTVSRIVMDVLPSVDNTGLPDGAPTVTAGTMQTIDFTFTGSSISELGRNGTDYFQGIIANPKYYDASGELIDSWYIDNQGSDTQKNRADSSNNLTLYGVNHTTDWYSLEDGYYLGYLLIDNIGSPFTETTGWVARTNTSLSIVDGKLRITCTSSGAFGVDYALLSQLLDGESCLTKVKVTASTPSLLYLGVSTTAVGGVQSYPGSTGEDIEEIQTLTADDQSFSIVVTSGSTGDYVDVEIASIREVLNP
jgi:hypothetical protein